MPTNSTGTPKTSDYLLGRGRLYFAPLDANDVPQGFRDLGNSPSVSATLTQEVIEHFSSRSGLKSLDRKIVVSLACAMKFVLEEFSLENLAHWFSGDAATAQTNAATAGFAEHTAYTDVVLGRWYEIKSAAGVRAYDVDPTKLTVEKTGAPDVALVSGTDFDLDAVMGMIFLKSTAVNIAAGDDMDITLTADGTADTLQKVSGLSQSSVRGAVKFISENANDTDLQHEFMFHKVTITPDGDLALIGDELGQMSFNGSAEKNANDATLTITTFATARAA